MQRPTKDQIQLVIDMLELYVKHNPAASLAMMNPFVNLCGTPMCHAGSFLAAHKYLGMEINCDLEDGDRMNYHDGAELMADYLGFDGMGELQRYAEINADWWGNADGGAIFCDEIAFAHPTERPNGAENLQDIINHWKSVQTRS